MLFFVTALIDLAGMAVSLWLAAYLLARGFPSRVTLRAVVVLIALTAFFLSAYLNIHYPTSGSSVWRAGYLVLGFLAWHDLAYHTLPDWTQKKARWRHRLAYASGLLAIVLLVWVKSIFADPDDPLMVTRVNLGPGYLAFGLCLAVITWATHRHLRLGAQTGAGPYNRYLTAATYAAAGTTVVGYLLTALTTFSLSPPIPRLFQDGLLFSGVALFGYAVARHQAFAERRTTLQDFPISGLAILTLTGVYALAARQLGYSAAAIAFIILLAILTHSTYDLVREFLDRLLHQRESELRRQLRGLARDMGGESTLQSTLQEGLAGLCFTLGAASGFVAIRQSDRFEVSASLFSLPVGTTLEQKEVACDDVSPPSGALAGRAAWLAPAFAGGEQVGVIGIGPRASPAKYTEADLDLLAAMADWVARITAINSRQRAEREQLMQLAAEMQARERNLQAEAEDAPTTREGELDREFVRLVEEGLRHLSDYATLGESALAQHVGAQGATHVERGKAVREQMIRAVEALRPEATRPDGLLPREWHGYAILHDAYIEDAPNREIMARLYISEGTFNRARRKALRAVARSLLEMRAQSSWTQ
jgi:hypothetical protein